MTKFNATAYASGLTVAQFNDAFNAGEITKAQALAVCKAKLSRENIRKGAKARWTRVAEGIANGGIDKDYAFTGKRVEAEPEVKAEAKPKRKVVTPAERMQALVSKRIMSKADKDEMASLIAAYVSRA